MNSPPRWFALVALLFLASCSTPQSRIGDHQAEFDKFPPDVQQKISHGQVDVGFTEEMVRLALGEPDRRFTRKTEAGELDVWGYHERRARVSFGLGFGTGGRHSAVGGAVGMSSSSDDPEERIRIEFRSGRVTAVEYIGR